MKSKRTGKRSHRRVKSERKYKVRHKITFEDENDLLVAFLGEIGWHTRAIAERCKISEGMVQYRLSKAGIARRDYRNGVSDTSDVVIKLCRGVVTDELRAVLPPQFM